MAEPAALERLFNWLTTALKAAEIELERAPLVIPNTTATKIATKAKMAPYSVIPCPDSSFINLDSIDELLVNSIKSTHQLSSNGDERTPQMRAPLLQMQNEVQKVINQHVQCT